MFQRHLNLNLNVKVNCTKNKTGRPKTEPCGTPHTVAASGKKKTNMLDYKITSQNWCLQSKKSLLLKKKSLKV